MINDWASGKCLTNCQSDIASTHQHLAQYVDRPLFLWHCQDFVIHRKSVMLESRRLGAICVRPTMKQLESGALAHCTVETQAGSPFAM